MVETTQTNVKDSEQQTLKIGFEPNDVAAWSDHLEKEGFVVLKGVLSKDDVDKSINHVFDWFEY